MSLFVCTSMWISCSVGSAIEAYRFVNGGTSVAATISIIRITGVVGWVRWRAFGATRLPPIFFSSHTLDAAEAAAVRPPRIQVISRELITWSVWNYFNPGSNRCTLCCPPRVRVREPHTQLSGTKDHGSRGDDRSLSRMQVISRGLITWSVWNYFNPGSNSCTLISLGIVYLSATGCSFRPRKSHAALSPPSFLFANTWAVAHSESPKPIMFSIVSQSLSTSIVLYVVVA